MSSNLMNLKGKKFGRLTVNKRIESIKYTIWECICDCGTIKNIMASNLRKGHVKSCGCFRKDSQSKRARKEPGRNGFSTLKNKYKKNAKQRKLKWDLNDEQLMLLFKGNCYYCNSIPKQVCKAERYSTEEAAIHSQFIYNGIDRINNNIGYEFENCVSCCKMCNWMKLNFELNEFFSKIEEIALYKLGLKK